MKWMTFKAAGTLAAIVLLGGSVAWAQVSVPNTFTAGTAAHASEVNANFQALVDAINSTNVNANTPVTDDGSLWGEQFSTDNSLTGRNVIVRVGNDLANNVTQYSVSVSYRNGSVLVNGSPTSFSYVRMFLYVTVTGGTTVVSAYNIIQGTNTLTDYSNSTWNTEIDTYGSDLTTPTVSTSTRSDNYLCYSAAISHLMRHCRHKVTDPGQPSYIGDDSRIISEISSAFTVGSLSFPNGGLAGAYMSPAKGQEYFLIGRNIGKVIENHLYGLTSGNAPNYVSLFAVYARVQGQTTQGSLSGTIFASGQAGADIFFTGT